MESSFYNQFFTQPLVAYQLITVICAVISIFAGYLYIPWAQRWLSSQVRSHTPERHQQKNNTPTMGGLFIITTQVITSLVIWWYYSVSALWILSLSLIAGGCIGGWDDWYKLTSKHGISATSKFIAQWFTAFVLGGLLYMYDPLPGIILIPGLNIMYDIGIAWITWAAFVIVSISNALNLTDGLDGLATSCLLPVLTSICTCGFIMGPVFYDTKYTSLIWTASLVGLLFGFLWHNSYRARIFMGDIGSLSLGIGLAVLALILKVELLLPIAGLIFVLETLSVVLQVFWYKRFGKKLFAMAPVHHHFELKNMHEATIVMRALIISIITSICAFIIAYTSVFK